MPIRGEKLGIPRGCDHRAGNSLSETRPRGEREALTGRPTKAIIGCAIPRMRPGIHLEKQQWQTQDDRQRDIVQEQEEIRSSLYRELLLGRGKQIILFDRADCGQKFGLLMTS